VDFLLNGIQSDNQIIVTAKTTVRMNVAMRTSFQIAVDHLSELIGATLSNASINGKQPARNVSRMESGRGNRGGRGRGGRHGRGGRGGRGNCGGKFHNDVDITDLARTYTDEEWRNLTPEVHQQIRDARKAKKAADANNKRNVAAVNAKANIVVPEVTAEPKEEGPASKRVEIWIRRIFKWQTSKSLGSVDLTQGQGRHVQCGWCDSHWAKANSKCKQYKTNKPSRNNP
jgi:hypothetical protein